MYGSKDEMIAAKQAEGYQEIPEYKGIKPGQRVRHLGHRYTEAYRDGTATVLAVMQKDPSSWAQTYGRPDVEIIVQLDKPYDPESPVRTWSDYQTTRIEQEARR